MKRVDPLRRQSVLPVGDFFFVYASDVSLGITGKFVFLQNYCKFVLLVVVSWMAEAHRRA